MSREVCLLIGQVPDPHIDQLELRLSSCDIEVIRFDSFPVNADPDGITYKFLDGKAYLDLHSRDMSIEAVRITAVFWRVKDPVAGLPPDDPETAEVDYAFREWRKAIIGLNALIPHALWINSIENHTAAGNKISQLKLAQEVGFLVPRTVISNRHEDIINLFETGDVIYKSLAYPFLGLDRLVLTSRVSLDDFNASRDLIQAVPCLFQNMINKAYELRITIIGNYYIAMRIDSQDYDHTKIDWRTDQMNASLYSRVSLPNAVEKKVFHYMKQSGLVYGAMDIVVDLDGNYIFLENNPGGQWLWQEEVTGEEITREISGEIARLLASRRR